MTIRALPNCKVPLKMSDPSLILIQMTKFETYETDPDYDSMYDTMKSAYEAKVIQDI